MLRPWAELWYAHVAGSFLRAYRQTIDGAKFVPSGPDGLRETAPGVFAGKSHLRGRLRVEQPSRLDCDPHARDFPGDRVGRIASRVAEKTGAFSSSTGPAAVFPVVHGGVASEARRLLMIDAHPFCLAWAHRPTPARAESPRHESQYAVCRTSRSPRRPRHPRQRRKSARRQRQPHHRRNLQRRQHRHAHQSPLGRGARVL